MLKDTLRHFWEGMAIGHPRYAASNRRLGWLGIFLGGLLACSGTDSTHVHSDQSGGSGGQPQTDPDGVPLNTLTPALPIGGVPGEFSPGDDGSANYGIPIVIPPGRAGIEPHLRLDYSSRSGGTHAGFGWTLNGLSVITRCPQRLATHGIVRGVRFDADDAYCLDGQPLVLVEQSGGTRQYRTELDRGARIYAHGGGDIGPDRWVVESPDGSVLEFGPTANEGDHSARVEGTAITRTTTVGMSLGENPDLNPQSPGTLREIVDNPPTSKTVRLSWLLRKVHDRVGNYFEVTYAITGDGQQNPLESYPTLIAYTGYEPMGVPGTGAQPVAPQRRITLNWEARPDTRSGFISGLATGSSKRLTSIETSVQYQNGSGWYAVRRWRLAYDIAPVTAVSRLRSITECDGLSPATAQSVGCRPATEFTYSNGELAFGVTATGISTGKGFHAIVDFDEDGRDDLVVNASGLLEAAQEVQTAAVHRNTGLGYQESPANTLQGWIDARSLVPLMDSTSGISGVFGYVSGVMGGLRVPTFWTSSQNALGTLTARDLSDILPRWSGAPVLGGTALTSPLVWADLDGNGAGDVGILMPNGAPPGGAGGVFPPCVPTANTVCTGWHHCGPGAPGNTCSTWNSQQNGRLFVRTDSVGRAANLTAALPLRNTRAPNTISVLDYDGDGRSDLLFRGDLVEPEEGPVVLEDGGFSPGAGVRYFRYSRAYVDESGNIKVEPTQLRAGIVPRSNVEIPLDFINQDTTNRWKARQCELMADINGDGLKDVLRINTSYRQTIDVNFNEHFEYSVDPPQQSVSYNTGAGFVTPGQIIFANNALSPAVFCGTSGIAPHIVDFNMDGRDDIVVVANPQNGFVGARIPRERIYVWLSNGSQYVLTDPIEIHNGGVELRGYADSRLADLNGDGLLDLVTLENSLLPNGQVENGPENKIHWLIREGEMPDLLRSIRAGSGVETDITYAPLNNRFVHTPATCEYPQRCMRREAMALVSHWGMSNGIGGGLHWFGRQYFGGRNDVRGRGFLGFDRIRTTDFVTGSVTETSQDVSKVLVFGPAEIHPLSDLQPADAMNTLITRRYTYPFRGMTSTRRSWTASSSGMQVHQLDSTYSTAGGMPGANDNVYTTRLVAQSDRSYELQNWAPGSAIEEQPLREERTIYTNFDLFSLPQNVTTTWLQGVTQQAQLEVVRTYLHDQLKWTTGKMTSERSRWVPSPGEAGAPVERYTQWLFDDPIGNALGQPSEVVREPLNPAFRQSTRTIRNSPFGLITETAQTGWAGDNPAQSQTRTQWMEWDPEGVFIVRRGVIHNGEHDRFATTTLWHRGLGVAVLERDLNGNTTRMQYDALGILLSTIRPNGRTEQHDYNFDAIQRQTTVTTTVNDGSRSETIHDVLGRPIRALSLAMDGRTLEVRREFDAAGRLWRVSQPFDFTLPPNAWSTFSYDAAGRVLSATGPTGTVAHSYDGLTETTLDPDGRSTFVATDSLGRATVRREAVGTNEETQMTFAYGPFSQLKRIRRYRSAQNMFDQGALSIDTLFEYDLIGRQTETIDPDTGRSRTTYNGFDEGIRSESFGAAGALVSLRSIRTEVDDLGRPTRSFDERSPSDSESLFEWDTAQWGAGALASRTGPASAILGVGEAATGRVVERFSYDGLQREVGATYEIRGEQLHFNRTFDALGRPSTVAYPSIGAGPRFEIGYKYNGTGALVAVTQANSAPPFDPTAVDFEYWRARTHNEFAQITASTFGNGTTSTRTYDPNTGRLSAIQSWKHKPGVWNTPDGDAGNVNSPNYQQAQLQNLRYLWSPAGDLQMRSDLRQNRREEFGYDALHRLRTVNLYDGVVPVPPGANAVPLRNTKYEFDSFGNRVRAGDLQACFGVTCANPVEVYGPHQMSSSTQGGIAETYRHNALGNQTETWRNGLSVRTVEYTHFNLPRRIQDNVAQEFNYAYSAAHERVFEQSNEGRTLFLQELFERRETTSSTGGTVRTHKFRVQVGGTTVAEVTIVQNNGANLPATVDWFLQDHLGSMDVIASSAGMPTSRMSYDAYGIERNDDWTSLAGPNASSTREGYTGHRHDRALGLTHMRGRTFDSRLGVFMTPDPVSVGSTQGFNRYMYVRGNPMSATDSSGFVDVFLNGVTYHDPSREKINSLVAAGAEFVAWVRGYRYHPTPLTYQPNHGTEPEQFSASVPNGSVTDPVRRWGQGIRTDSVGAFLQSTVGRAYDDVGGAWENSPLRYIPMVRAMAEAYRLPMHYLRMQFQVNTNGSRASATQTLWSGAQVVLAVTGVAGGSTASAGAAEAATSVGRLGRLANSLRELSGRSGRFARWALTPGRFGRWITNESRADLRAAGPRLEGEEIRDYWTQGTEAHPGLEGVNPSGSPTNCVRCAEAGARLITGETGPQTIASASEPELITVLPERLGISQDFRGYFVSRERLTSILESQGVGARGVVNLVNIGLTPSDVINYAVVEGAGGAPVVLFLDFQSARVGLTTAPTSFYRVLRVR